MKLIALLAACLASALPASPAAAPASEVIKMTATDQVRLGVLTSQLSPREEHEGIYSIIRAVDPKDLFTLIAELDAARAATVASGDELARLEKLARADNSASKKSVQSARQQATLDAAQLKLLNRRLAVEWGTSFSEMATDELSKIADAISKGEAALVRADCPENPEGVTGAIEFALTPNAAPIGAAPLGLSGSADARMQTIGLYGVVDGDLASQVRPGRIFFGEIKTAKILSGVVVPRSAIIRLDGESFVYVKTGADSFERRPVSNATMIADGWFVTEGFSPGDVIVSSGVGSMLAVEHGDEAAESD